MSQGKSENAPKLSAEVTQGIQNFREVRKCTQNVRKVGEFKLNLPLGTLLHPIQLISAALFYHIGSDEIYQDDNLFVTSLRLLVLGHTKVRDYHREGE